MVRKIPKPRTRGEFSTTASSRENSTIGGTLKKKMMTPLSIDCQKTVSPHSRV